MLQTLTRGEKLHLQGLARHRESYRRYRDKQDLWQRGLVPHCVFLGLCGELAMCKFLNRRLGLSLDVDAEDRPRGDDGFDLHPLGLLRVQVKTRQRDYGSLLIRRETDGGRVVPIHWDVCVCATIARDDEAGAAVSLDGWVDRDDVIGLRRKFASFVAARRGDHMNLEVGDERLSSVADLATKIRTLRAQRS